MTSFCSPPLQPHGAVMKFEWSVARPCSDYSKVFPASHNSLLGIYYEGITKYLLHKVIFREIYNDENSEI